MYVLASMTESCHAQHRNTMLYCTFYLYRSYMSTEQETRGLMTYCALTYHVPQGNIILHASWINKHKNCVLFTDDHTSVESQKFLRNQEFIYGLVTAVGFATAVTCLICVTLNRLYLKVRLQRHIYVNTTLFTMLHCYMFQASRGILQGVLTHFVSRVNKVLYFKASGFEGPASNIRVGKRLTLMSQTP
jgi:hypothetical protein